MANEQRLRRFVVFALVAGAHVMLLMLPFETELLEYEDRDGNGKRTQLFFPRTPVSDRRSPRELRAPTELQLQTNIDIDAPSAISVVPPEGASTSVPGTGAPIDWSEAGRRAAAAAAEKMSIPERSRCDSTGLSDPELPNCKPPPEFKWAPPKAGFSGGLPYVRLGERCAVGLGFFGCSLGKPPARGDLFSGMDDPERERSSVPDPNRNP